MLYKSTQTDSTHFEQVDLTVRVVVVLEAIKGVVVPVAVNSTHSWTRRVAAVKIATVTHTKGMDRWTHKRRAKTKQKWDKRQTCFCNCFENQLFGDD